MFYTDYWILARCAESARMPILLSIMTIRAYEQCMVMYLVQCGTHIVHILYTWYHGMERTIISWPASPFSRGFVQGSYKSKRASTAYTHTTWHKQMSSFLSDAACRAMDFLEIFFPPSNYCIIKLKPPHALRNLRVVMNK